MSDGALALSLRDLSRRRGAGPDAFTLEVPALDIRRGEAVALTGPSGSGKSTLRAASTTTLSPPNGAGGAMARTPLTPGRRSRSRSNGPRNALLSTTARPSDGQPSASGAS